MPIEPGGVALVTGSAGGLGLAIARALGQAGMRVMLTDIDADGVQRAAGALTKEGMSAAGMRLDVRSQDQWAQVGRAIERSWGPVSVLCNNAGISALGRPVAQMDWEYWALTQKINVDGVFNGVRTFLPGMLERAKPAHIVNTASAAALGTIPDGSAAYLASKYAVLGLSEALRQELAGSAVRVSVLCPGAVRTDLWRTTRRLRDLPALDSPPPESALRSGSSSAMEPSDVAQRVVQAIREDQFFVLTHGHYRRAIEARHHEILTAFEKT